VRGCTGASAELEKQIDKETVGMVQEDTEAKFEAIKALITASALGSTTSAYQQMTLQITRT
jgi:hypothetical protein